MRRSRTPSVVAVRGPATQTSTVCASRPSWPSGQPEEAYARYAISADRAATYLGWFRAVANKYPSQSARALLADLVRHTPGDRGQVVPGLAALRWLVQGYGYDVTALDVRAVYSHTLTAAANAGVDGAVRIRIRASSTIRPLAADSSQVSSGRKWAGLTRSAPSRANRR